MAMVRQTDNDWRSAANRVVATALDPLVIDSVAVADRALRNADDERIRRCALGRIQYRLALECWATGYRSAARQHMLAAIEHASPIQHRRMAEGCIKDSLIPNAWNPYEDVVRLVRPLVDRGVVYCVVGSVAISIHAGHLVKESQDLDIDVGSEGDFDKAIGTARDVGFQEVARKQWTYEGLDAQSASFVSRSGARLELGWLPRSPMRSPNHLTVRDTPVVVAALPELRETYLRFMKYWHLTGRHRWSSKHAVLTIDSLLDSGPTLTIPAVT